VLKKIFQRVVNFHAKFIGERQFSINISSHEQMRERFGEVKHALHLERVYRDGPGIVEYYLLELVVLSTHHEQMRGRFGEVKHALHLERVHRDGPGIVEPRTISLGSPVPGVAPG